MFPYQGIVLGILLCGVFISYSYYTAWWDTVKLTIFAGSKYLLPGINGGSKTNMPGIKYL